MYLVYKTNHIAGIGVGILIVSQGTQSDVRFAEYHILLPNGESCKKLAARFLMEMSEEVLSNEELRNHICEWAKNRLQKYVDTEYSKGRTSFPPLVMLNDADDTVLRRLRLAGVCEGELNRIAIQTSCNELKAAIRRLNHLPVISTNPLE